MEKEETERQDADVWRESELARRLAGSGSACFSAYAPGVRRWGEPFRDVRRNKEHSRVASIYTNALSHIAVTHFSSYGRPKLRRQPPSAADCCQPQHPVCSATPQAVVFGALELSQPFALPTMPFCVLRHHQNCPSAPTKIGASYSVRQPGQPVTATANRRLTCWEADIHAGSVQTEALKQGQVQSDSKVTQNKVPKLVWRRASYHLGLWNIPLT